MSYSRTSSKSGSERCENSSQVSQRIIMLHVKTVNNKRLEEKANSCVTEDDNGGTYLF